MALTRQDLEEARRCARLLGLAGSLSGPEIKAAYHRAMLEWHPDLHQGKDTLALAESRATAINEARDFLMALPADTVIPAERKRPRVVRRPARRASPAVRRPGRSGFDDPRATAYSLASSVFAAAAYNELARTLYLQFNSGTTYRYFDVPRATFAKLLRARSSSAFAARHIFRKFEFERC